MVSIITFIVFAILITAIGFPLCFVIFRKKGDRGFAFSKLIVISTVSYLAWVIGHIGHSFTFSVVLTTFLLIGATSLIIYQHKKNEISLFIKTNFRIIIFEELVFWIFFVTFLLIRSGNPDLWHPVMGGEKPMDFAFINAIVRSTTLPPYDPWLSGNTMNYYYFGQFIIATLIKLINIPSSVFYNIFLAYLFGQVAQATSSIIWSQTKSKIFSIFGIILLLISGNLGQIPVLIQYFKSNYFPINGWYWTATRIMPNNEINEFPYFTFLYADLHSHLIALPISLLVIALALELYKSLKEEKIKYAIFLSIVSSIILGILRITNIWDYPTYLLLLGIIVLLATSIRDNLKLTKKILLTGVFSIIIVAGSNLSIMPFILSYKTGSLGINFYSGPQTRILDYVTIHGLFLVSLAIFTLLSINLKNILTLPKVSKILIYFLFAISIIFLYVGFHFLGFLMILATLVFMIGFTNIDRFPAIVFVAFAIFLTSIPDIIDIKLGLGRMNTVFKFYFQAWTFFAIGTSICAFYIFQKFDKAKEKYLKIIAGSVIGVFLSATLIYPITASVAKINDRMGKIKTISLNGSDYMKSSVYFEKNHEINLAYDLDAINWINYNIKKYPVIVEANTPIYRWGSRISVYTGLPTVLGWDWHEIAHRQYQPPDQIQIRASHINEIYTSFDFETTKSLLMKYNVSYIYLGQLEKAYYNTKGFEYVVLNHPSYFQKIFSNPEVTLYKFDVYGKRN